MLFKMVKKYFLKYKVTTISFIVVSLITWMISLLTPYITGRYIDSLVYFKSTENLYKFIKLFMLLGLSEIIIYYFQNIISIKLQTQIAFKLNFDVIEHVKRLPITWFKDVNSAYLNQKINSDSNNLSSFIIHNIINIFTKALTLVILIFILFKLNAKVSIILILFIPLYILCYIIFRKPLYKTTYEYKEKQSEFFSAMNEQYTNIKLIKLNSWFDLFSNKLNMNFNHLFENMLKYAKVSYIFSNIDLSITRIANILLFIYGGFEVINHKLSIGDFTIINSYFNMLLSCTHYFLELGKNYQNSLVSYTRLKEIFDTPLEINGTFKMNEIENIKLKNVSFYYNNTKKIIENFNYIFKKGNIYCITGKNGAGKSTLINIMLGLINDYKGDIYYNNKNIRNIDLYNVRKNIIGITEQEPILLNDTIRENITYGTNNVSDPIINNWCKKFYLYEFINKLPEGLNSNIYEKANNISSGEKQKISLIRTLIKAPQIIVFDEPTSALDKASIDALKTTLKEIKYNKIIIFITHNPDIINIADEVINF